MNFQSQSANPNNLRLQQPLSVCSNLLRSLVTEIGIISSNFTKLPNLPKFSATLLAVILWRKAKSLV